MIFRRRKSQDQDQSSSTSDMNAEMVRRMSQRDATSDREPLADAESIDGLTNPDLCPHGEHPADGCAECATMDMPPRTPYADDMWVLAEAVHAGRVFGSWMFPDEAEAERMMGMVFLPLLLGAEVPRNTAHIYEYLSEAGPRQVNGYPIFMSMRLLTKDQTEELRSNIEAIQQAHNNARATAKSPLTVPEPQPWYRQWWQKIVRLTARKSL